MKNIQILPVLLLLLVIGIGCSNPFSKADDQELKKKAKIERLKPKPLADAKTYDELVNSLKQFGVVKTYILQELSNPEKVAGKQKMGTGDIIAQSFLRYKPILGTNSIFMSISRYSNSGETEKVLDAEEKYQKGDGVKPIRSKNDAGIQTLSWRKNNLINFIQCHKDFCFRAWSIPDGDKLEDILKPLTLVAELREEIK